jgi:hypothetical protein
MYPPVIKATIGVNAGYNHENKDYPDFCEKVQEIAEEYYGITGIYVSFVITRSTTVYREAWGCPKGGEVTYTLETTPNPIEYKRPSETRLKLFCEAATNIIGKIASEFNQRTVLIQTHSFEKSERYVYVNDDEDEVI